jgi:hypothetical protein
MGQTADQVRNDIERTRAGLTDTFDEIGERVSPRRIVQRRTDRMRDGFRNAKETVMGTASSAGGSESGMADSAMSTVTDAPDMARRQTEGNPIAAGLIAFGGGLLLASILPKTDTEQHAAEQLRPHVDAVKQQAMDAGREMKDELSASAQDAAEQVKQVASQATAEVKDEASSVAHDVRSTTTS